MKKQAEQMATFLDALVAALTRAASYNRNDQTRPAAVLWTDGEGQWESLAPLLPERLPLLTLGSYDPTSRSGPAYWLRCVVDRTLPDDQLPDDATPIIYLPRVSKQELRAVEESPRALQPLAELQYRGVIWTQVNGRDWTIPAFLQTKNGGLGIEVAGDNATREAMQRALLRLADTSVARLRQEAPLRAAFFDSLLNPDEVRSLLLWLNDPLGYPKRSSPAEWGAFRDMCRRRYDFDPITDGPVTAAQLLGQREGAWETVWRRFAEAPASYPNLPDLLRRARPATPPSLFADYAEGWPQDNQSAEDDLRRRLTELADQLPAEARAELRRLEEEHGARRGWVWATVEGAPLAAALEHLVSVAEGTTRAL
ncbi:MAG TPA: BREX-1 system phosphatase PglZ type B, partial [Herpetosiphonaceae bacterium]|nr:BREX-1 system phosphatase PglZ type B [Herpetosiphonaceae bacterium]